jgi:flagellar hook-length control protein FliK
MNGEEMNSASILVNLAPAAAAAPASAGAEQAPIGTGGFDQALASVQSLSGTEGDALPTGPATMELVSNLLLRGASAAGQGCAQTVPGAEDDIDGDSDVVEDAAGSGAASILAQMLAGSSPPSGSGGPPVADAVTQAISSQPAVPLASGVKPVAQGTSGSAQAGKGGSSASEGKSEAVPESLAAVLDSPAADSQTLASAVLQEKTFELPSNGTQPPQSSAQAGTSAQAVVQAAASALRDAAPAAATFAPAHATLREPVGTARWAEEVGNHLVLMSVRGQQEGSLTLTPEHLGPVEVQISMNRDTANVWFGAQHADTRTALAEAMPRLRELLASSGLSLGQSGVSEQAPRGNPAPPPVLPGVGARGTDTDAVVEASAPAWRVWRPGRIDTYV